MTVQELFDAVHSGDPQAASGAVSQAWRDVYEYAYRMVRNVHEAEEIAQETFLRALRSLDRLDRHRPARPWLFRVATRLAIDSHRRRRFRALNEHAQELSVKPMNPEKSELLAALGTAVEELPNREQAALVLRVYDGLRHAEIARILDCTESNTRWLLHHAKLKLREHLKAYL